MIEITPSLSIDENEIQLDFIRSSGPGGQNVNKVASAVQLRFDVTASSSLPEDVKLRLHSIAGSRITDEGILIIEAKRFRTQEQNREDAVARLVALIYQATEKPKPRKKTRPSAAANAKRLDEKRRRSQVKHMRRMPHQEHE
jgi:ribosome-associated protein